MAKKKEQTPDELRESMMEALQDTKNVDLKGILDAYENGDETKKEQIVSHYKVNSNAFINAVFRGDLDTALIEANEPDKKLLSKV